MLVAWVLQPLLLLIIAVGIGLCVEAAARTRFSLELLVAVGIAAAVVVADLARLVPVAGLATVAVPTVAAGGFLIARARVIRRLDWVSWAGVTAGVFVLAAPFLVIWEPTFGGYTTLGDTAVQMLGAEFLPRGTVALEELQRSAVTAVLDSYFLGNGYPAGPQTLSGVAALLLGAWSVETYQPFLVVMCGALGLATADMLRGRVAALTRGAAAMVAVSAPLVTAYAWQGSIKEVAGAAFIAVSCAAMQALVDTPEPRSWRTAIPLVVAGSAVLGALGFPAGLWLLPVLAACVLALVLTWGRASVRPAGRWVVPLGLCALVLAWPTWRALPDLWTVAPGVLTLPGELGNLLRPLPAWQAFAPWPVPDYRQRPDGALLLLSAMCAVLVAALAVGGAWWAVRRAVGVAAWGFACAVGWLAVGLAGSPWSAAKAMALAAPAILVLAVLGGAWGARRLPAVIAPALVLVPVLVAVVSDIQGARGLSLAPVATLRELRDVTSVASGGATLILENDEFAKVAAARATPEVIGDVWRGREVRTGSGVVVQGVGQVVDVDALGPSGLRPVTWVVVRSGPATSWPAGFRLVRASSRFLLFGRDATTPTRGFAAQGRPLVLAASDGGTCDSRRDRRVGLVRPPAFVSMVADWAHPQGWERVNSADGPLLRLKGAGEASGELQVREAGRYRVWVGGSFPVPAAVTIDGERVPGQGVRRNYGAKLEPLGTMSLRAGSHPVSVRVQGGGWRPGGNAHSSVPGVLAGVWVERTGEPEPDTRTACGADQAFDWFVSAG